MSDLPTIRLIAKRSVAEGTMAFEFTRPDGFRFTAGQFGEFTLIDPPETDAEGDTRAFSLASAPHEPTLVVATRMRDTAFKRVLRDLPVGAEIEFDAPFGGFGLPRTTRHQVVLLTGGIGVTPVRSMVRHVAHAHTGHQVVVFYANNRTQDAAFLDDLQAVAAADPAITLIATMAKPEDSDRAWDGETGLITEPMLHRHLRTLYGPQFFLCGPRAMVVAMRTLLDGAGVDPDSIRTEEFSGY